jgi:hypothetical protein
MQTKNNDNYSTQLGQPDTHTQEHATQGCRDDIEEDKYQAETHYKSETMREGNPPVVAIRFPTNRTSSQITNVDRHQSKYTWGQKRCQACQDCQTYGYIKIGHVLSTALKGINHKNVGAAAFPIFPGQISRFEWNGRQRPAENPLGIFRPAVNTTMRPDCAEVTMGSGGVDGNAISNEKGRP